MCVFMCVCMCGGTYVCRYMCVHVYGSQRLKLRVLLIAFFAGVGSLNWSHTDDLTNELAAGSRLCLLTAPIREGHLYPHDIYMGSRYLSSWLCIEHSAHWAILQLRYEPTLPGFITFCISAFTVRKDNAESSKKPRSRSSKGSWLKNLQQFNIMTNISMRMSWSKLTRTLRQWCFMIKHTSKRKLFKGLQKNGNTLYTSSLNYGWQPHVGLRQWMWRSQKFGNKQRKN